MLDPAHIVAQPAPGRECGTCTLCCKIYDVPAVESLAGQWCRHAKVGKGCGIHATRPDHCRAFHCLWMTEAWLGPEWKPERAKMVLGIDPGSRNLSVQVDPGQPNVWRREPFLSQLRRWAAASIPQGRHVLVHVNRTTTVVLPDRDVPLGTFAPGDRLVSRPRMTPQGPTLDVERVAGV
ncbi:MULTISPECIES: hypothetical protein [Methylobacterium]|uniref:YkgJ family cysteine cluster protein n=1 Tax=Methylobacterium jeotgali TaxID=381630 RepID=A0ABQ4T0A2_9HYPH|nr:MULTISPECIES: hypothetical protein [Methylobacterium]PIU05484.1 MAG: hypothetical protein COT56_14635 [Methylobacterium sp. CG09_land_8_20_14_0_10_71_15]PIU13173.1 MAG: hypothetical protein COT28_12360 [Methylobacterium sp. CG08_land_8_20_14_0_20_71_15]GBU19301.1 hypothetical protein AwMethylo_35160 [Methylobacterium sp.]GJE07326.1 hypothetical protein AOPFMNJM_2654 [Methylobacterium jeotgali]